jgi:TonB family protein
MRGAAAVLDRVEGVRVNLGIVVLKITLLLLIAPLAIAAQESTPVEVHEPLHGSQCELVQPGVLANNSKYAEIHLQDGTIIFGPDLDDAGYVSVSKGVKRSLSKAAKKSMFQLKKVDAFVPGQLHVSGNNCPRIEDALESVAKERAARRARFQAVVYDVSGDLQPPMPIDSPQAEKAAELQEEPKPVHYKGGLVVLQVVIGLDGKISRTTVVRSSSEYLSKRAMEAVHGWKFSPVLKAGLPIQLRTTVEINFRPE